MTRLISTFQQVLSFIESNLEREIDLDQLCQTVPLSKFHFHRLCTAYFGVPLMTLVTLMRLKRAAYSLAFREDKILTIALTAGYDSHEAFSRAFKRHFAQSPSAFRRQPDWANWQHLYEPVVTLREKIMTTPEPFDVEIVELPSITLATMEHRGSPNGLGQTIAQFIHWRKQNQLPPRLSRTFNLVYDDPNTTADEDYRFDLGCQITAPLINDDERIIVKKIPSGKYAKLRHKGSDDTLGATVTFLYRDWLSENPFDIADFPLIFERVLFFPDVSEQEMITDVYLPLIPSKKLGG